MTTWTDIIAAALDPDSPIDQALMTALRDNPVAIAEGALGAPRVDLGALRRLETGTAIRSRNDGPFSTSSTSFQVIHTIGFLQKGQVRVSAEVKVDSGAGNIETRFALERNGTTTTTDYINSAGTYSLRAVDPLDVLPGDELRISYRATAAATTVSLRNARILTNGQNLFPISLGAKVSGNVFN